MPYSKHLAWVTFTFMRYFDMKKKPYGGMFGNVEGEICGELVNGTNIFLGNPNNPIIDKYTTTLRLSNRKGHGQELTKRSTAVQELSRSRQDSPQIATGSMKLARWLR